MADNNKAVQDYSFHFSVTLESSSSLSSPMCGFFQASSPCFAQAQRAKLGWKPSTLLNPNPEPMVHMMLQSRQTLTSLMCRFYIYL